MKDFAVLVDRTATELLTTIIDCDVTPKQKAKLTNALANLIMAAAAFQSAELVGDEAQPPRHFGLMKG